MEDSQRQAHYEAWAKTKKWVEVEVTQTFDGSWMAECKETDMFRCREKRADAIRAIQSALVPKGYEIKNLYELLKDPEAIKAKRRALNQTITDFEIALHFLPWYAFRRARELRKQMKEVEKELENYR